MFARAEKACQEDYNNTIPEARGESDRIANYKEPVKR